MIIYKSDTKTITTIRGDNISIQSSASDNNQICINVANTWCYLTKEMSLKLVCHLIDLIADLEENELKIAIHELGENDEEEK